MKYFIILSVIISISFGILSQFDLDLMNTMKLNATRSSDVNSQNSNHIIQFYDYFGDIIMNDYYHYIFEEMAMNDMIQHCDIQDNHNILEIGPGSGYLAELILKKYDLHYIGIDVSKTMSLASSKRLQKYMNSNKNHNNNNYNKKKNIELHLTNNTISLLESWKYPVNRYIFTYVLDLLPNHEIEQFSTMLTEKLKESQSSKVCIINLTYGFTPLSRIITNIWQLLYITFGSVTLGGCRPIRISDYFYTDSGYSMDYVGYTVSAGLPSEIAILSSHRNTTATAN